MSGRKGYRFLITGFVLLFGLAAGLAWFLQRAPRPASRIRHVILISIDTCRSDYLSSYGAPWPTTPHIDELAQPGHAFRKRGRTSAEDTSCALQHVDRYESSLPRCP